MRKKKGTRETRQMTTSRCCPKDELNVQVNRDSRLSNAHARATEDNAH